MLRQATAVWNGGLKDGKGTLSTPTQVLTNTPYTFVTRFENTSGTSPEELVAAAHAGCFSMALSADLGRAGLTPQRIETTAEVTLETVDGKPTVTKVLLKTRAAVPGADRASFERIANETKATCPISRLLNAKITLEASLEG